MAKKRPPSAPSSPSSSGKKPKTLDGFFHSPAKPADSRQKQIIDDEAFAWSLAEDGGIPVDGIKSKMASLKPGTERDGEGSKATPICLDDNDDDISRPTVANPSQRSPSTRRISVTSNPEPIPNYSQRALMKSTSVLQCPIIYPDFGIDPLVFNVSKCPWNPDGPTPYSFLAHVLQKLSQTRSRILLINTLTNALRMLILYDPPAITPSIYMISNSIGPSYIPVELGLGPKILSSALQSVSGLTSGALRKLYNTHGDSGDVAFAAKASVRTIIPHPALTLSGVYDSLIKISRSKGAGATKQRQSIVERLLLSAKGEEVRFIMRTLSQHLRVGAVRTTVLTALARAAVLNRPSHHELPSNSSYFATSEEVSAVLPLPDSKGKKKALDEARESIVAKMASADALLKMVYVQHPNFDDIVSELIRGGLENLASSVPLTVGTPLHPTLGSPTRSLDEIYDRLGDLPFAAEFKYDGQRAQVHGFLSPETGQPTVKIYSRHLEDMTEKYPDITELIKEYCTAGVSSDSGAQLRSFIIDAEVVAWDVQENTTMSFQELSNRPRKDVNIREIKIPICLFVFDLMYLNDEPLLSIPFRERRRQLRETFPQRVMSSANGGARLAHVMSADSDDPNGREGIESFWETALDSRCEGLMLKLLDNGDIVDLQEKSSNTAKSPKKGVKMRRKLLPATYEPDKRTSAWLKLKKDYVQGVGDTLDLVPIGAWHGNGRKAAWWSPILLAVWDEKLGHLVAVCKCMSGFSDEFYRSLSERYQEGSESCSKRGPLGIYEVGGLEPAVYFEPREVWEIACAEITISPVSVAAIGEVSEMRGLSVRFPRFVRVREDKRIEDATRSTFLAELWRKQDAGGRVTKKGADDGDLVDADIAESDIEENGELSDD